MARSNMLTVAEGILDSAAEYREINLASAESVMDYALNGCDIVLTVEECEKVRAACLAYVADDSCESNSYYTIVEGPLSDTMEANVELAVKDEHGVWELLGDFATVEAAKQAAKEYASQGQYHIDDHGVMVFGISEDPASGHYENTYSVEIETGEAWAV